MSGEAPSELTVASAIRVGWKLLGQSVRLWATLVLSFALFAWALAAPGDWRLIGIRLLGATVFCALVHVPAWRKSEPQG